MKALIITRTNRSMALVIFAALALIASGFTSNQVSAQNYVLPDNLAAHIRRGVEAPTRSDEQRARDAVRLPAQILTLGGLNEGDHIAEITAFGQYFSNIIVGAIGESGHLNMYDMPFLERFGAIEQGEAFAAAHNNADYEVLHYNEIEFSRNLDGVYNILFYHDFGPQEVDTAAFNQKVFEALRPGGVYLVIDHKANPGTGWEVAGTIHRIDPAIVIAEVTAAGFVLVTDSDLLANPDDPRTENVFSPDIRGGTDQFLLVFQKPE